MRKIFQILLSMSLIFALTACSTAPNGLNDNKSVSPDKTADELATQTIQAVFEKGSVGVQQNTVGNEKLDLPTYKSSYQEILEAKDYLYGAYYQQDKIYYLFTFIDNEKLEKLELTLQKVDDAWQLLTLTSWDTKGTKLTEKEIYNKIGKGRGEDVRIFERGANFMRM
ncbi:hypothetical protein DFP96_101120 [Listeria rocourtiae]|uniref:Lipoprotein n=2 Tax=Listeria rocourtiae TaxID=647910 RepID=A0A4R6ZRA3_9LIST|nr:hypothetical protein PROCOU_04116 [Listeria rocourtiae FSL F6-920]TDR55191.1 hypothetical protein DFP96_101120 [Listeria rocourtiae]